MRCAAVNDAAAQVRDQSAAEIRRSELRRDERSQAPQR